MMSVGFRHDSTSYTQDCAGVVKLRTLPFRPLEFAAQIDDDLALRVEFHVCPIHGPRRRPLEVHSFGIVATAVARALELVLAGLPVRSAAQVCADRRDDENALGVAHYPDAVLILKLGIHTEAEVRRISDAELC